METQYEALNRLAAGLHGRRASRAAKGILCRLRPLRSALLRRHFGSCTALQREDVAAELEQEILLACAQFDPARGVYLMHYLSIRLRAWCLARHRAIVLERRRKTAELRMRAEISAPATVELEPDESPLTRGDEYRLRLILLRLVSLAPEQRTVAEAVLKNLNDAAMIDWAHVVERTGLRKAQAKHRWLFVRAVLTGVALSQR